MSNKIDLVAMDITSTPWDYWEQMKQKSWNNYTTKEKNVLIQVCLAIANELGIVLNISYVKRLLETQLPIDEPNVWLKYANPI